MAGEQVQTEQGASRDPPKMVGRKEARPRPGPHPEEGETVAASGQIGDVRFKPVQGFNARIRSGKFLPEGEAGVRGNGA
jgi:hypothetical protein